jgi:hypothetical protein
MRGIRTGRPDYIRRRRFLELAIDHRGGACWGQTGVVVYSLKFKSFNTFGQGQGFNLAIEQDGVVYRIGPGGGTSSNAWATVPGSGILLTESDFLSFDGLLSLDFTNGGLITFGFVTWKSSGNSISVGYDNYSSTLTVIPVPLRLLC